MKHEFIVNNGNSRLILIFAGWSSYPDLYKECVRDGWDLSVVYDFDDFHFDTSIIAGYSTIYLYAWSLGVADAECVLDNTYITAAFAINGTTRPVDDRLGIPTAIFRGTADTLNARNLLKFRRRMLNSGALLPMFDKKEDEAGIAHLQQQLYNFMNRNFDGNPLDWRRVYIATDDRIFPASNQKAAWETHSAKPEIIILSERSHYIPLKEIIDTTIHDTSRIARRFQRALPTYDDNASAQNHIAETLTSLIDEYLEHSGLSQPKRILELGAGSGLFSKKYATLLQPEHITYIDLYPISTLGLAASEKYIAADAEQLLECEAKKTPACDSALKVDALFSASTIQWFLNPERFFENVSKLLPDNGMMAISTFLPGNLQELNALRPSSIIYTPAERLRQFAERYFKDVEIKEETYTAEFDTAKEALRHLSLTGVGGGINSHASLSSMLRTLQPDTTHPATLTYRIAYLLCHK